MIMFDSTTGPFIFSTFPDFKKECKYCHAPVESKNLSAVTQGGFVCDSLCCIITLTGDDPLFLEGIQKCTQ